MCSRAKLQGNDKTKSERGSPGKKARGGAYKQAGYFINQALVLGEYGHSYIIKKEINDGLV